ncbi:MAG: tripartite tricarboxylate transporter substrate binding protein [Pseudomonadota bacterium]
MVPSRRLALAGLLSLCAGFAMAQPQPYPARPVKIIVPLAPGGSTDLVARSVGIELSRIWGVPVIIENRVGAGGVIGLQALASAPPDGYTLMLGNVSTNALNQTIYADKMSFKPDEAMVPVTMVATVGSVLIASNQQKPTLKEFIADAKANPGKFNYASTGIGAYGMLDGAMLMRAAGMDVAQVPYPAGGSALILPLLNNDAQIAFLTTPPSLELVRAGKVRAYAVTAAKRIPQLPDVPTMAELGFPGVGTEAWQGLFAPTGTPSDILQKIHAGVQAAVASPAVQTQFDRAVIASTVSPSVEDFRKVVTQDIVHWRNVVHDVGLKLN